MFFWDNVGLGFIDGGDGVEIKAKCIFDYKGVKALTYVTMYKRNNPQTAFHFLNTLAAFMILAIIWGMQFGVDSKSIYLLVLYVIIFLFNCFLYFVFPRMQYRALDKMKGIENEYTFCNEGIKVTSKHELYNGDAELKYSMIPKVMETSAYLFIYQSKNQVFIVDKSTITGGSIEDIRQKLIPHLKKKYIICKY